MSIWKNMTDKIGNGMSEFLTPYLNKRSDVLMYKNKREEYQDKENHLWYLGDEDLLANFYQQIPSTNKIIDVKANYFYANVNDGMRVVHSGLPKVLSKTMAKLLFSGGYSIEMKDEKSKQLLEDIIVENKLETLNIEGATTESWGGKFAYKIINSDTKMPVVQLYKPDEFKVIHEYNKVKEVVFETEYCKDKKDYKLLETYGYGYIQYNLYVVRGKELVGVPITTLDETAELVDITFDNKIMLAGVKTKNSIHGTSDYEGIISEFDSLDEVWSSYIEEIRKGKTITYIPANKMQTNSQGAIIGYDKFKTEYAVLETDFSEGASNEIKHVQPDLRSQEFKLAIDSLVYNICNALSISPVTVGIDDSSNISGLSRQEKEKASLRTRDEMTREWSDFLNEFYGTLLNAYNLLNKKRIQDYEIEVMFNDYITATMKEKVDAVTPLVEKDIIDKEKALKMIFGDDLPEEELLRILANVGETSMEDTTEEEIIPEVGE